MSRSVPEWIGANDDQAIPARVKIRVFTKFNGRCAECTVRIAGKIRPAYDHCIAIVNGGKHAESNLQLLCVPCHAVKTRHDVALKAKNDRVLKKTYGLQPNRPKMQSRGFAKAKPQRTASRPINKWMPA